MSATGEPVKARDLKPGDRIVNRSGDRLRVHVVSDNEIVLSWRSIVFPPFTHDGFNAGDYRRDRQVKKRAARKEQK